MNRYHPILTTEHPLTLVQRLAEYYQRAALIKARALIDPDFDERTRKSDSSPRVANPN